MATSYYSCDGSVTTVGSGVNQGLQCSTGWQTYTPPETQTNTLELTGEFVTLEQGRELMAVLFLLFAVIAVYRGLGRFM